MDYSTHGANMWNIHFLGPANMQKISILQCKMEVFCIFSIYQKWTTLLMGQTCGISISWGQQICKKSPFYNVKWRLFAYFPFTKNGLLYSWGKPQTCGISIFWGQQICKKSPFYSVKWRFFAYFPFTKNGLLYSWGKHVEYPFSGASKYAKNLHFTV